MSSNIHTPSENVVAVAALSVAITAAATNGASTDTRGFESALVSVYANPSGSGTTSDFKLQESADNSTWADITGAAFTQITTAGGAKTYVGNVNCGGGTRLRYIRVIHTGGGGSAAGQAMAFVHLMNARRKPVAQSNTVVFSV